MLAVVRTKLERDQLILVGGLISHQDLVKRSGIASLGVNTSIAYETKHTSTFFHSISHYRTLMHLLSNYGWYSICFYRKNIST